MIGLIRFLLPLLVILTVAYVVISVWSRRMRRAKLEAHWDKKGLAGDKEAFVERGLKAYDNSFRRKLILGVYVVPLGAIIFLIIYSNFM
ncbi:hypothetical protein [Primorskyibacter sp. S87]|uniref:hypothetical protein n=1 Tax=Primorskyibacter sp. S87 TaxID=3415126 RepID=UPI003C7A120E